MPLILEAGGGKNTGPRLPGQPGLFLAVPLTVYLFLSSGLRAVIYVTRGLKGTIWF